MLRLAFGMAMIIGWLGLAVTGAGAGGGWYLLQPQVIPSLGMLHFDDRIAASLNRPPSPITIASDKPLREWDMLEAYDSAAACEEAKRQVIRNTAEVTQKFLEGSTFSARSREWWQVLLVAKVAAKCIATDDPRLK